MNGSARRVALVSLALVVTLVTAAPPAVAQCVSLTTLGSASTQDFNTLSNSGTSSTVPTGWYFAETGTNANTLYSAGTGSSNSGDTYSFGASGNAERAFGGLRSGSLVSTIGACFTNNTGGTITSLDVAFTGEQWRIGVTNRGAADRIDFQYSTTATSLTTGTWSDLNTLDYSSTVTSGTAGALDGNGATNRTAVSSSITGLSLANGATIWIRWTDFDISSSDDGLAVDDFSVTPQGTAADGAPTVSSTSPTNGATGVAVDSDVSVTFSEPVDVTGAWYTIVCASSGAHTAAVSGGPSTFTLNPDTDFSAGEACTVTIVGTLVADQDANDPPDNMTADYVFSFTAAAPPVITLIHDIQGSGAAVTGAGPFTIEGIVTGDYQTQGSGQLRGFFVQEEDTDEDANPATSEGIFVFCSSCPTAVAEGQRVRVTGSASEFFNMSQISATTAGAVTVLDAGNNLALVTPTDVALPVPAGTAVNDFFEPFEGMLVRFTDTLTVAEHYELFRFGQVELYAGGRPVQFTQDNAPSVAGYSGFLDDLSRRRVILDDDTNTQNGALTLANGLQAVYYPRTNGGFSIGTQGPDFFRTGDVVAGLTGVLHWSFNGLSGTDAWRIRPTAANPVSFIAANPRPASPPAVGGSIRAAGLNLLNYFTTIDTTASDDTGPCGPSGTLDCRGADSTAELDRQRARVAQVLCGLNADVYGLIELENEAPGTAVADLLGAVNGACGGAHPYAFAGPSGTIGTDAVRVAILYRTGILTPVGAALVDLDAVHHRPPTAQPFEVTDATNPAFGKRFTVVANHLRAKGCSGSSTGLNADQLDGQGCNNLRRTEQAQRTLDWINSTVLPAAGDPNVLLLGDFNAYPQEDPITTLVGAGYSDVLTSFLGAGSYSYIFDGQIGHLDFALTSASLTPVVTGAGTWHINADESALFDYNDEIADTGEASFEEKPDGSSLAPPRTLWDAPVLARAADHDPVVVGLFAAAGVSTTITDTPDPVYAGAGLAYTVTVANGGPESATGLTLTISVPAGTTYVGTTAPAGWSCAQAAGTVTCTAATLAAATNAVFTMSVTVGAGTPAGTVLSSTAAVTQTSGETTPGDESDTEQTTVQTPPSVFATKAVGGFAYVGGPLTYTVVLTNYGSTAQADNAGDEFVDVLPASLVLVSASATSGTAVANVGTNTVTWNGAIPAGGSVAITIEARVSDTVTVGSVVSNQGTISYDGNGDLVNESSAPTDDPATGAVGDPTAITVLGGLGGLTDVPTLGGIGLGLLALLVALGGALVLGRRLA